MGNECDECKGHVKDESLVRILVSEGMGKDDNGVPVESGQTEYIFCSYKCFRAWAATW